MKPVVSVNTVSDDRTVTVPCQINRSMEKKVTCYLYTGDTPEPFNSTWTRSTKPKSTVCNFYIKSDDLERRFQSVGSRNVSCDYSVETDTERRSARSDSYSVPAASSPGVSTTRSPVISSTTVLPQSITYEQQNTTSRSTAKITDKKQMTTSRSTKKITDKKHMTTSRSAKKKKKQKTTSRSTKKNKKQRTTPRSTTKITDKSTTTARSTEKNKKQRTTSRSTTKITDKNTTATRSTEKSASVIISVAVTMIVFLLGLTTACLWRIHKNKKSKSV
ncbi:uncharacterized protein LOC108924644 isoform X2 [Scleropages formosus]|nr:uncharacterized protein LOC108924644 isoform X2 [Scleropages formosus]